MRVRSVKFPRFRTAKDIDSFEKFLISRVERTLETGLLFLIILKLLKRRSMAGSEVRKVISTAGFSCPHQTTLYTHLAILRTMKLVKGEDVGKGHRRKLHVTEKGLAVLEHAEEHLENLVANLSCL